MLKQKALVTLHSKFKVKAEKEAEKAAKTAERLSAKVANAETTAVQVAIKVEANGEPFHGWRISHSAIAFVHHSNSRRRAKKALT